MAFNFSQLATATGVTVGSIVMLSGSAQAFSFTTNYTVNAPTGDLATGDIFLDSIEKGDGTIIQNFSYVTGASIIANDEFTGGDTGGASADIGDHATTGIAREDATAADIVTNLGNNNLNNIIDTEDTGSFEIDLSFGSAIDNLLIWERGKNSQLGIQAVDDDGNLIGERLVLDSSTWDYAGFDIDTQEINSAQRVGSIGVNIAEDLGVGGPVSTVRFFSESGFNGPDWKFVGTDHSRSVPEPSAALGLGLLGGLGFLAKRKKSQA